MTRTTRPKGGEHEQGAHREVLLLSPQIVCRNERGYLVRLYGGEVSDHEQGRFQVRP